MTFNDVYNEYEKQRQAKLTSTIEFSNLEKQLRQAVQDVCGFNKEQADIIVSFAYYTDHSSFTDMIWCARDIGDVCMDVMETQTENK